MKPIIRWTLGPVCPEGIDCLFMSIRNMKSLYGTNFDYFLCHNCDLTDETIQRLELLGVIAVDQRPYEDSLPYKPFDTTWKMYPPRLRMNAHEITIDNDLVLYKRLPAIESFLAGDHCIISAAHQRGDYGQYSECVMHENWINSGLYGLPPGYDLAGKVRTFLMTFPGSGWKCHCDDEGVLASILFKGKCEIIPLDDLWPCNPTVWFAPYRLGKCGMHFVAMNSGNTTFWNIFLQDIMALKQRSVSGPSE